MSGNSKTVVRFDHFIHPDFQARFERDPDIEYLELSQADEAGAWAAFVVILFMLVGWFIAKFWMGEIDFVDSYERFLENKGRR